MKTLIGIAATTLFLSATPFEAMAHNHGGESNHANMECSGPLHGEQRRLRSEEVSDLCELTSGKVTLVVNTASQCGYTGQFEGLEALYQEYKDQGFTIVGFPSNSFRQEHSDEEEVAEVCFANFGVTFPMMATSDVTGRRANPVFAELTQQVGPPGWNFHKYLVGKNGEVITSFPSSVEPQDERVTSQIRSALN
ncbi:MULTISPECIES: glutathione peroxidase [Gammaproteobacteria]|uniref:glutathione peroxidase n=1 Tax=Gammaproteobacteria TaxID=1236 RepID=UPI000DD056AB|nr:MULTISPECIES: glutathione peroxidase [Gammaproteobacteria]RTE85700.1 glutathione peroxidase [Aliidiomarina sp. B3213]TCZ90299.1 glutathione peroxidase [Lysobacter sp. N42]